MIRARLEEDAKAAESNKSCAAQKAVTLDFAGAMIDLLPATGADLLIKMNQQPTLQAVGSKRIETTRRLQIELRRWHWS